MKAKSRKSSRVARLSGAAILVAAATLLGPAFAAAGATAGSPNGTAARPGNVPKPGDASVLDSVFCSSSADCWAVGYYEKLVGITARTVLTQALHWNGRRWSRVSTPNPAGTTRVDANSIDSLFCTSRANCWAVGGYSRYSSSGGASFNLVLHWNGRRWSTVATPQPKPGSPSGGRSLNSVSCTSASNCWTVGFDPIPSGNGEAALAEALHWNGRRWSLVATPQPAGTAVGDFNSLSAVRCVSARDCWAVGADSASYGPTQTAVNLALRWNGRRWSQVAIPSPGGTAPQNSSELSGLSCISASNCWAVGDYVDPANPRTGRSQAMHWNGRTWSQVATPQPAGTVVNASQPLNDIHCTSAGNCWAVGSYRSIAGSTQVVLNQALHWDGAVWSLVRTPDPAGTSNLDENVLIGIRCVAAGNCWAVGLQRPNAGAVPAVNEILHWNGRMWSAG